MKGRDVFFEKPLINQNKLLAKPHRAPRSIGHLFWWIILPNSDYGCLSQLIFKDFWPNWARNRFAQFFRALYTTSKPRKILPKQSSSNIFSWTKRSCSSTLPGVPARGVCWSSYYHVRVRVFTELQNPEQNFYLVFWFLSDHRPNRTFKIYNSHWKKKNLNLIKEWSLIGLLLVVLYACMHQCSRYGI